MYRCQTFAVGCRCYSWHRCKAQVCGLIVSGGQIQFLKDTKSGLVCVDDFMLLFDTRLEETEESATKSSSDAMPTVLLEDEDFTATFVDEDFLRAKSIH